VDLPGGRARRRVPTHVSAGVVGVCLKWVDSLREPGDDRYAGVSAADRAALELALQQASLSGATVRAVTIGDNAAVGALRLAAASGAHETVHVRVDGGPTHDQPSSAVVASALAAALKDATMVWCGDYSADRGSATVPALLAHALGAAQALGVVGVELAPPPPADAAGAAVQDQAGRAEPSKVRAIRRLDGGRREVLSVSGPAVISVEGSAGTLRRAGLQAMLRAGEAPTQTLISPSISDAAVPERLVEFRPRTRGKAAPAGASVLERLRVLTDASGTPSRGERFEGTPQQAAQRIVEALTGWGYL
jgi:electron transfer flavoprotein beta subunit